MEHFYYNIGEDWFSYPELYSSIVNKFGDNSHFVEVGVWKGRSASYMGVEIFNSGKNCDIKLSSWVLTLFDLYCCCKSFCLASSIFICEIRDCDRKINSAINK